MTVRALDADHDWTFGMGRNNYISNNAMIAQQIQCNLLAFKNDCFFSLNGWIDWFSLLGTRNSQKALELAISSQILSTEGVTGSVQVDVELNPRTRGFSAKWSAQTVYSKVGGIFALTPTA
jgi:hypothetical protein